LSEVRLLQSLPPHPNVVSCYDAFWDDTSDAGVTTRLMLVLEYGDAGDLDSFIQTERLQHRPLSVDIALDIFAQVSHCITTVKRSH
jgi:serine/threonine protein kinase